ncbi:MAG: glycosyltransferase family 4 protein [Ignavibacteria bacterium]|nr:glycosyltransferase family 4 protein [Ignavibacteria bacterium]
MSKKILYLIKTMDVGGAERFTLNLSTYMQSNGFETTVYSSGGIFTDLLREKNVTYIYSDNAQKNDFISFFKIRQEIKKILSEKEYDIIHCQHRIFVLILSTIKTGRAKIIYTAHNYFDDFLQKLIKPDYAIAISPTIEKNLKSTLTISHSKISCINLGVDSPDLVPWKNRKKTDNITIGYVGRLLKEKGILNLLQAFNTLKNHHSELRLKIVGKGPLKNEIINFVEENKLNDLITINEPLTDIDAIYKNIDILVLPTQMKEGLPISILEAMARGILVITCNSGGIGDVIINGETGIVLESGSIEEINANLDTILSNYPNLKEIIQKAKVKVTEDFSLETMLVNYNQLYKNIA